MRKGRFDFASSWARFKGDASEQDEAMTDPLCSSGDGTTVFVYPAIYGAHGLMGRGDIGVLKGIIRKKTIGGPPLRSVRRS